MLLGEDFRFRPGDSDGTRLAKLNRLLDRVGEAGSDTRDLYLSIAGLADADPAVPLLRVRFRETVTLGGILADAGIAATGTPAFPIHKDGVSNGDITFTAATGTGTITDPTYLAGSLLEIFPPAVADATLDEVSISIPLTVG